MTNPWSHVDEQSPVMVAHKHNHRRHVEAGYCTATHESKTFCTDLIGHAGRHSALFIETDGSKSRLYWSTDAGCPCSEIIPPKSEIVPRKRQR